MASDETGWLFLGMPRNKAWINCLSKDFKILSGNFSFQDTQYGATTHAFLGVFKPPGSLSGVAAVFLPGSVSDRQTVARKISHYGKYGYLMFKDGQNITKGVWPVSHSPVRRLIEKPS
jgi:hypothetical protein